jgi:hypothetical protein
MNISDLRAAILAMPASQLLGLLVTGFDAQGISCIELPLRADLTFEGRVVQGGLAGCWPTMQG